MNWSAAELGGFLTAAGAALVLLVKTCFSGFSESRCETLKCCGCYITRKIKTDTSGIEKVRKKTVSVAKIMKSSFKDLKSGFVIKSSYEPSILTMLLRALAITTISSTYSETSTWPCVMLSNLFFFKLNIM